MLKNMAPYVGPEKSSAIDLYEAAVHAPSVEEVSARKAQYGRRTAQYLNRFHDNELYRAHSNLQDLITSSQGAESQMYASLRNKIRAVEPQTMLKLVVETQRTNFMKRKAMALRCTSPVPPHIEKHLAQLIQRARQYQDGIVFVEGTNQMEATVVSRRDASKTRRVILQSEPHTPRSAARTLMSTGSLACMA